MTSLFSTYVTTCDKRVYRIGAPSHLLFTKDAFGYYIPNFNNPPEEIKAFKFKRILSTASMISSNAFLLEDNYNCTGQLCTIDVDVEDVTIIIDNATIVDRDVHMDNTQVVIVNDGSDPYILVDGAVLFINSSNILYNIENYSDLQDGHSIVIVDTTNGGSIQGSFGNVELVQKSDECKSYEAELVQTESTISMVFKVKDVCSGLAAWVIVLITLFVVIAVAVAVACVVYYYKTKENESATNQKNVKEEEMDVFQSNDNYEGKSKVNPLYD